MTDPYNAFEKEYELTRGILEQLADIDCRLYISTKSSLILRDLDLLKKQKDVIVDMSLNTLDDGFRRDMDRASSVSERLRTLRALHENGIYTVLFISPLYPGITDYRELIEVTREFVPEYWFENLNLRGDYKHTILAYIHEKYPQLDELYHLIFQKNGATYWRELETDFTVWCGENGIKFVNAFNHTQLVKEKKETGVLKRLD